MGADYFFYLESTQDWSINMHLRILRAISKLQLGFDNKEIIYVEKSMFHSLQVCPLTGLSLAKSVNGVLRVLVVCMHDSWCKFPQICS